MNKVQEPTGLDADTKEKMRLFVNLLIDRILEDIDNEAKGIKSNYNEGENG